MEQRVKKPIGWPGDVYVLSPLWSRNLAQISQQGIFMRFTELPDRDRKNIFSTYSFTTTGIVGIFSHLKNCPALLSHNLIIITSIVLQPVEKQIQVRVPLVLSIHKLCVCVCFFSLKMVLREKTGTGALGGVWTHVLRFIASFTFQLSWYRAYKKYRTGSKDLQRSRYYKMSSDLRLCKNVLNSSDLFSRPKRATWT